MSFQEEWDSIVNTWEEGKEIVLALTNLDEVFMLAVTISIFIAIFIFVIFPILVIFTKWYIYKKLRNRSKNKKKESEKPENKLKQ